MFRTLKCTFGVSGFRGSAASRGDGNPRVAYQKRLGEGPPSGTTHSQKWLAESAKGLLSPVQHPSPQSFGCSFWAYSWKLPAYSGAF